MWSLALLLSLQVTGAEGQPVIATDASSSASSVELWQGLRRGMTPAEVAHSLTQIRSIKRAKVVNDRKPAEAKRVSITYDMTGYTVAGARFEIGPMFKDSRLDQVGLQTGDLCAAQLPEIHGQIFDAMARNYGPPLNDEETALRARDVYAALGESNRSGKPTLRTAAFESGDRAALLAVRIWEEAGPPPPPQYASKAAYALWQMSLTMNRNRRAECPSDSGLERAKISIIYLSSADLRERMAQTVQDYQASQTDAADKLK
jgi:hypothetical protein